MTWIDLPAVARGAAEAKLRLPIQRRGLVERGGLLERLEAVRDDASLVLVTAPAGYGKTTVLSQWAAADHSRRFGWVTLDKADGDPVRLAGHVALALHGMEALDPRVFRALAAGNASAHVEVLPDLLASLHRWSRPGVLVLDDVHELRSVEAMNFIRAFSAGVPLGFHIAIASRLGLGLGRIRSEGRCVEFGLQDLAFAEDDAHQVLASAGVVCSDQEVAALVRHTEGWPAGVYLSALAIRASPGAAEAASAPSGDDAFIVDYLRDELLARESPEMVRFMLRTAPLDQMCGSLCDHVLGRSDSASRLADAAQRSLFVVPLDRRGEWYRYHRLVTEMLLSELRRREPGEEFGIHQRAAGWYEQRGRPEEAIAHALDGRDTATAARLVNRHAREFWAAGRLRTIRGWLDALDDGALVGYPPVAITAAWISALEGDPLGAHRFLYAAERGSFERGRDTVRGLVSPPGDPARHRYERLGMLRPAAPMVPPPPPTAEVYAPRGQICGQICGQSGSEDGERPCPANRTGPLTCTFSRSGGTICSCDLWVMRRPTGVSPVLASLLCSSGAVSKRWRQGSSASASVGYEAAGTESSSRRVRTRFDLIADGADVIRVVPGVQRGVRVRC
jgi:LuxR family maltose regulon positive regulatory protein